MVQFKLPEDEEEGLDESVSLVCIVLHDGHVVTVKDVPLKIASTFLAARLELLGSLPSDTYELRKSDGSNLEELCAKQKGQDGRENRKVLTEGEVLRVHLKESWTRLFNAIQKNLTSQVIHFVERSKPGTGEGYKSCDTAPPGGRKSLRLQAALFMAAGLGHFKLCSALLRTGASNQPLSRFGRNALHAAAAHDHLNIVQLLVQAGFRITSRDSLGQSPVHVAKEMQATSCERWMRFRMLTAEGRAHEFGADSRASSPSPIITQQNETINKKEDSPRVKIKNTDGSHINGHPLIRYNVKSNLIDPQTLPISVSMSEMHKIQQSPRRASFNPGKVRKGSKYKNSDQNSGDSLLSPGRAFSAFASVDHVTRSCPSTPLTNTREQTGRILSRPYSGGIRSAKGAITCRVADSPLFGCSSPRVHSPRPPPTSPEEDESLKLPRKLKIDLRDGVSPTTYIHGDDDADDDVEERRSPRANHVNNSDAYTQWLADKKRYWREHAKRKSEAASVRAIKARDADRFVTIFRLGDTNPNPAQIPAVEHYYHAYQKYRKDKQKAGNRSSAPINRDVDQELRASLTYEDWLESKSKVRQRSPVSNIIQKVAIANKTILKENTSGSSPPTSGRGHRRVQWQDYQN